MFLQDGNRRSGAIMGKSPAGIPSAHISTFLSYSHADEKHVRRLMVHLSSLERELGIVMRTGTSGLAGGSLSEEQATGIADAGIFLLCLSPDYLASQFIYYNELPAIRQRAEQISALVIPIILRRCSWWGYVGDRQVVPVGAAGRVIPISDWRRIEDGYDAAAEQIGKAIRAHLAGQPVMVDRTPRQARVVRHRPIQDPPSGPHTVSKTDIDRAVRAVLGRRVVDSDA